MADDQCGSRRSAPDLGAALPRRVRALEEGGYLKGYHAEVNAEALGFGVTVFAHVGPEQPGRDRPEGFRGPGRVWPMVRECHMLAGETDFLLKIVAHDWDAYQKFLTTHLTPAPNVSHVKSALAIRTSKLLPGVPIEAEEPQKLQAGPLPARRRVRS
jgi:DNA-binding Lrp family transcriptional regulator